MYILTECIKYSLWSYNNIQIRIGKCIVNYLSIQSLLSTIYINNNI